MSQGPDDAYREWVRRLRDQSRRDAESIVPRPNYPVYGLAAPTLASATSAVAASFTNGRRARDPESELLREIDAERKRVAVHAGVDLDEPAEPPRYTRETLPADEALVCRHGAMWAARLIDGPPGVIVTISGHGTDPDMVRLETVTDLAPMLAARGEVFARLRERRRATPPPVLEPPDGVAAWRALADFSLAANARMREAARAGREPRTPVGSARCMLRSGSERSGSGSVWPEAPRGRPTTR